MHEWNQGLFFLYFLPPSFFRRSLVSRLATPNTRAKSLAFKFWILSCMLNPLKAYYLFSTFYCEYYHAVSRRNKIYIQKSLCVWARCTLNSKLTDYGFHIILGSRFCLSVHHFCGSKSSQDNSVPVSCGGTSYSNKVMLIFHPFRPKLQY